MPDREVLENILLHGGISLILLAFQLLFTLQYQASPYPRTRISSEANSLILSWKKFFASAFDSGEKRPADMGRRFVEVPDEAPEEQYFASSKRIRYPRPAFVKFRIGQVIKHRRWGYKGIIVGWDESCKAPDTWIAINHQDASWRNMPNYSVLRTGDDPSSMMYVAEANIIPSEGQIENPILDHYVDKYENGKYVMKKYLRDRYPED